MSHSICEDDIHPCKNRCVVIPYSYEVVQQATHACVCKHVDNAGEKSGIVFCGHAEMVATQCADEWGTIRSEIWKQNHRPDAGSESLFLEIW